MQRRLSHHASYKINCGVPLLSANVGHSFICHDGFPHLSSIVLLIMFGFIYFWHTTHTHRIVPYAFHIGDDFWAYVFNAPNTDHYCGYLVPRPFSPRSASLPNPTLKTVRLGKRVPLAHGINRYYSNGKAAEYQIISV